MNSDSVAVVGGGVIGLSVAWKLSQIGYQVTVFDDPGGDAASDVAAGMIAPFSEARAGEEELLALSVQSLAMWEVFVSALAPYANGPLVVATGTVWVGFDEADAADLEAKAKFLAAQGFTEELQYLSSAEVRRRVDGAGAGVRVGAYAPTEMAVDNRQTIAALRAAAADSGARTVAKHVAHLDELDQFGRVVVCAGMGSAALLPELNLRPVKGEVVRLRRGRYALPPPSCVIRAGIHGRQVYVVPRTDGVVVGATQYEVGAQSEPTLGPLLDLLLDAAKVLPWLREYHVSDVRAGLRPTTSDNLPVIAKYDDRIIVASGHARGGFLLAPITAHHVGALMGHARQEIAWN